MKLFRLQLFHVFAFKTTPTLAFSTHSSHRAIARTKFEACSPKVLSSIQHLQKRNDDVTALRMAGVSADELMLSTDKPSRIQDMLAGLTVAFSLLSKAIACSAIVGVNPLVGMWSSVVMGITAPLSECFVI
jgi:MFS superfamily sulfate permease-like transporter